MVQFDHKDQFKTLRWKSVWGTAKLVMKAQVYDLTAKWFFSDRRVGALELVLLESLNSIDH